MDIPEWIDPAAWEGFVEMRKRIKQPLTERAMRIAIRKLEQMRAEGYDANASLDESTFRGWAGVFPQGEPNREAQRTWKPGRVNYSASDREYLNGFYKQHPDLMPPGWKQ